MKKSKIIVPALAVLCLSTAAAVSGTVAWFSAARTAKLTASSTVINPEGQLNVSLEQLVATKTGTTTVEMAKDCVLRDASVDTDGESFTAYRAILGSGTTPASYKEVNHLEGDEEGEDPKYVVSAKVGGVDTDLTVYYYASFRAEFSINGNSETGKYDIFFDAGNSTKSSETHSTIQNGYRVAMMAEDKDEPCVWAPFSTGNVSHVADTDASVALGTYTPVSGTVTTAKTASAAQADAKYLGTIEGDGKVVVEFVMWYEGTDASVVTNNLEFLAMDNFTYNMQFNAISQADYAA